MSKKQQSVYSREFKVEAVKLVNEHDYSIRQAAERLGIHESVLRRWKKKLEAEGETAFPGKGHQNALEEENRRLREENKRLQMERDILKKAARFFANESK